MLMSRVAALVAGMILVASCPAMARQPVWFVSCEGGVGRASLTREMVVGDFALSPLTVTRQAVALGVRYGERVSGSVEVAMVERGAQDQVRTVFRPEGGQRLFYERTYIDLAMPVLYRIGLREGYVSFGAAPRFSVLAEARTPFPTTEYPRTLVVGVDPQVRAGFRWIYATGRYLVDVKRPYERPYHLGKVAIRDEAFFLGLGIEVVLGQAR